MATNPRDVSVKLSVKTDSSGVVDLAADLRKVAATTVDLGKSLEAAGAELGGSKKALTDQVDALARLALTTSDVDKKTDAYKATVQAAKLAILDARVAVRDKTAAYAAANVALQKSADLEKDLAAQVAAAAAAASEGTGVFSRFGAAVKSSFGQFAIGNLIADGVATLVGKVREMGAAFVEANVHAEQMRNGLSVIYGSAQTAASQIDFLRSTANKAGLSFASISDSFVSFSAATKTAGISLQTTNDLFSAVTQASHTLGLSSERVTLVLQALGQMAGKGTVAMEELRQQLGESLPGALALSAQAMGISEAQLIKLVESGKLAAEDFFPALTKGLQTLQGSTETLSGGWARMLNVLNQTATAIGEAGGIEVMNVALKALLVTVGAIVVPLQGFIEVLNLTARGLDVFWTKLSGGDAKKATADFQVQVDKSTARMVALQKTIDDAVGSGERQTKALTANAAAHSTTAAGIFSAAAAQERAATATAGTTSTYTAQMVALTQSASASTAAVTASEKLLQAKQAEGKALVLTAQLTGDATKELAAASVAATANAAASEAVVVARQREADNTRTGIALINSMRDATGRLSVARQQQLDDSTKLLQVQDAEAEKARQMALELGRQALAAQAASEALADNSTKLDAYRQSMDSSQATAAILTARIASQTSALADLKIEVQDGHMTQQAYDAAERQLIATKDELSRATGDAAKFERLYRDAVSDTVTAITRKARAEEAAVNTTLAQANADQKHYETLANIARAQGNETLAIQYSIDAKERQIEATRLSAKVKQLELDAEQAGIEVEMKSLSGTDDVTKAKRAELEIRLEVIKAKRLEAGASDDVVRGLQAEIDAIRNRSNVSFGGGGGGGGGGGFSGGGRGGSGGFGGGRSPFEDSLVILDHGPKIGSENYSNGRPDDPRDPTGRTFLGADGLGYRKSDGAYSGQATNLTPVDKAFAVQDQLKRGGTFGPSDIPMLQEAVKQALDSKQWLDATMRQSAGVVSPEAIRSTQDLVRATQSALANAQALQRGQQQQQRAASTQHTVNITLPNGQKGSFGMASADDASGISDLLSRLGQAKGVSREMLINRSLRARPVHA